MRAFLPSSAAALLLLTVMLPAATDPSTSAPMRPTVVSDDPMIYDLAQKESVVTHGKITFGGAELKADEIHYNTDTLLARATGHFELTTGSRRLLADSGSYNFRTKELSGTNLRLGEYPLSISGDTLAGTWETMTFTNATMFLREADAYSPTLRARRLTYQHGQVLLGEDVEIGLYQFALPPIHLKYFQYDLDSSFLSYLRAKAGYRNNLGALAELGVHVPVSADVKLGCDLGFYSARGLLAGPSGSYGSSASENTFAGFFRSGYIKDHGNRQTDILGRPVPVDRSFFEWQHWQQIGNRMTVNGMFNYWRDSEILRDFRNSDFLRVQQPDSFFEGAYAGDNYVVSVFTRIQPNHFHRVQERLPEMRFDLLPTPVGGGFYALFNAGCARLKGNDLGPMPAQRTDRLDAYVAVARPLAPTPWFAFTPVTGGRLTHYSDPLARSGTYTRTIGEVGFDSHLLAAGTFEYKNEIWNINGLRHLFDPHLIYRYAPEASRGRRSLPQIDTQVFATDLPPLSIGDQRNIDDLPSLNTLRLSLDNTLQTRDAVYGSRDLASFVVAADYRFDPPPDDRRWSALHSSLSLSPAPWLRLAVYNRITPQDFHLREWNTGLELIDQEWWSLRFSSHYLEHQFQEYFIDYRRRINEVFDAIVRFRFDAQHSQLTEQTYGLWQKLGQSWAVKYEVTFSEGPRREGHFGLNVDVNFLKF
ncbi:MAG: LPS assembly protein LptD [Opitutaceae bacterium]|nr:LPS assembly protein LptD [Opitutaceae bacterium]